MHRHHRASALRPHQALTAYVALQLTLVRDKRCGVPPHLPALLASDLLPLSLEDFKNGTQRLDRLVRCRAPVTTGAAAVAASPLLEEFLRHLILRDNISASVKQLQEDMEVYLCAARFRQQQQEARARQEQQRLSSFAPGSHDHHLVLCRLAALNRGVAHWAGVARDVQATKGFASSDRGGLLTRGSRIRLTLQRKKARAAHA